MALQLRIKFPQTYPVIYKTLRLDAHLTVRQAINYVNETLRVDAGTTDIGLYLPHQKRWLDDDQPLSSEADTLQEAEEVEFKDKREKEPPAKQHSSSDDGCHCVLF